VPQARSRRARAVAVVERPYPAERERHSVIARDALLRHELDALPDKRGRLVAPPLITDSQGLISDPYRAVDLLRSMQRSNRISREMRLAGEGFSTRFGEACFEPLQASDIARPVISGKQPGDLSIRSEFARRIVWRAIIAAGGLGSRGGSCLWRVLGEEISIRRWCLEQGLLGRMITPEAGSGILIAALEILVSRRIFD
jgi:hypothetical protein